MGSQGGDRSTGVYTNPQITITGTIMASTCSLLPLVQDVPPRKWGGHTKMNNAKTEASSVLPH